MKSYSEAEVFSASELAPFKAAQAYVDRLDERRLADSSGVVKTIRCHELTRAVGRLLKLAHEDGVYCPAESNGGGVDHSWLCVPHHGDGRISNFSILDVYSVGRLPQVQLLYCGLTVPHHLEFMPRAERTDIDEEMVLQLIRAMLPIEPMQEQIPLQTIARLYPRLDYFNAFGQLSSADSELRNDDARDTTGA